MVKLGFYKVKKRYKKRAYQYEEVCLHFPKELHELLGCLRNRKLEIKASREGNVTTIKLIDRQES
jgi:hypothetical protein